LQKLINEVAVGAVNLNAVESSSLGVLSTATEVCYDPSYLGGLKRSRRLKSNRLPVRRKRSAAWLNGGRGYWKLSVWLVRPVRDTADVPELKKYRAMSLVNRISD
jgi:hypothetical protein